MGCLESKPEVGASGTEGGVNGGNTFRREAENAVALLSGASAFSSWVEIHVSALDLKNVDNMGSSDPMAVLYESRGGSWQEISRTECVSNTRSPSFAKNLKILYNFEKVQQLKLCMVDVDGSLKNNANAVDIAKCDPLGLVEFQLSHLVAAKGRTLELKLQGPGSKPPSKVKLVGEENTASRTMVDMVIHGVKLRNREMLSKSDPFLEICRKHENTWMPVMRTEVKWNNLNPPWNPIQITANQLNQGDATRPLMLRVYDYNDSGKHGLIGEAQTSSGDLEKAALGGASPIILHKTASDPTSIMGELVVKSFSTSPHYSFLDYIQGGVQISFMVGIDFTGSNGDPRSPNSLHYLNPAGGYTDYEKAIMGIGQVLECYDATKLYPVYGFGGRFQGGPANHCFPLHPTPPHLVAGVNGILSVYRPALSAWALAGPTNFAPLIRFATAAARQPKPYVVYNCLLILTDGAITDTDDTIDAIIEASTAPLSIVIVGIGHADFTTMNMLDADKGPLKNGRGGVAARDIVQFVQFSEVQNNPIELAARCLGELPGQLVQYMRVNRILPSNAMVQPQAVPTSSDQVHVQA